MTLDVITVTYYYIYNTGYTVTYVDYYSGETVYEYSVDGYEGDDYSVEYQDQTGYRYDYVDGEEEGVLTKDWTYITYYVVSESEGATVYYLNKVTSKEIADSETITGYEGDSYTSSPKDIDGYTLVDSSDNTTGTLEKELTNIYYYYLKNTSVEVSYVDEIDGTVLDTVTISGLETDEYTTEQKEFDGYSFSKVEGNATGEMEENTITVTYYYKYISTVTVVYINTDTGETVYTYDITGLEADEYSVTYEPQDGYSLNKKVDYPDNEEGYFTKDVITVTYYLRGTIDISFTKVGEDDEPLEGVVFKLYMLICEDSSHDHSSDLIGTGDYDESCWELVGTYTSDSNGIIYLEDLAITEEFRLVEISTVDGYLLPNGEWKLIFDDFKDTDEVITLNDEEVVITSVGNPPAASYSDGVLYIHNEMSFDIPTTGGIGTKDLIKISVSIIVVGFVLVIYYRKKKINK